MPSAATNIRLRIYLIVPLLLALKKRLYEHESFFEDLID